MARKNKTADYTIYSVYSVYCIMYIDNNIYKNTATISV